jgi:hypothetical protein
VFPHTVYLQYGKEEYDEIDGVNKKVIEDNKCEDDVESEV